MILLRLLIRLEPSWWTLPDWPTDVKWTGLVDTMIKLIPVSHLTLRSISCCVSCEMSEYWTLKSSLLQSPLSDFDLAPYLTLASCCHRPQRGERRMTLYVEWHYVEWHYYYWHHLIWFNLYTVHYLFTEYQSTASCTF